jgi:peptidyl-prolyl cis-trans isomerase B (cyclophilin B)
MKWSYARAVAESVKPRIILLAMRVRLLALLAACALLLAACGDDDERAGATPTPEPAGEPEPGSGCEAAAKPEPKAEGRLRRPTRELAAGTTYVATVVTNCGEFEITLDSRRAPRTGGSFAYLVGKGFYDGLAFHRIAPGFVIQGGDPKGNGQGGPGYSVVEAPPDDLRYTKGVVAMAKTQLEEAGTSGSQFFVVTAEDAELAPDYALLGEVTGGLDVVAKIGVQPTTPDEQPVDPIVIQRITLAER